MTTTQSPHSNRARHPALVLISVSVCTALVVGFIAAINLAVPMIGASSLRPTSSDLLWIVDAYVVVFACLVIPAGAVGDRFGRKGVLLTGLAIFALGAAASSLAPSVSILLIGRSVTGLGAALVLPNCVAVLIHATRPERRGHALAMWAAASGIGGVVGNVGGGTLLNTGSWQLMFTAAAVIAVACLFWVSVVAPRSARRSRSLDPLGTVLFVAAMIALLMGIIEGPQQGWASATVVISFAVSIALGMFWVFVELHVRHPMLDPRLFRNPLLSGASLGMVIAFFGNFGLFYVNASLLQYSRGYSVLQAGLGILPLTLPLLFGTRYVPGLVRRFGPPAILTTAFLATSVGLVGISFATPLPYIAYAGGLFIIGIGIMLAGPCLTAEIATALPLEQAGIAGGLQSATREFGSALGVAVIGTVLTANFTQHLPAALSNHIPVPHTVSEALAIAPAHRAMIVDAFTDGADTALRVASVITLIAGAVVVAVVRRAARQGMRATGQEGAQPDQTPRAGVL